MMKVTAVISILKQITKNPTRYDNKTDRWAGWVNGAWLFDCCRLLKAVFWGFCFNKSKKHGGAIYKCGYPDYTCKEMIDHCYDRGPIHGATLVPGELLYMPNHVGLYIGDGRVIECSPKLRGVKETPITFQPWTEHGKLTILKYPSVNPRPAKPSAGLALELTQEPLYASSSKEKPAAHVTGTRYCFDDKIIRGRVRICRTKADIAKGISAVEGWIAWKE